MGNAFAWEKLQDPTFFEENRLPAHSDHRWYRDEAELARGESSYSLRLDGVWYFHYARNLALRPEGFEAPAYRLPRLGDDPRTRALAARGTRAPAVHEHDVSLGRA